MVTSAQSVKKILVLGPSGMLGRAVVDYFDKQDGYQVHCSQNARYPSKEFDELICEFVKHGHFIINCIGAIPQKTEDFRVNYELPRFLSNACDGRDVKVIHPSTDCEFQGQLFDGCKYYFDTRSDAKDDYGISKIKGREAILSRKAGKVIRSSVVGLTFPFGSGNGLLDWALFMENSFNAVHGYTNHKWNGVTVLEWAKAAHEVMDNYPYAPEIIQLATEPVSKNQLISIFYDTFNISKIVIPTLHFRSINRCLHDNYSYHGKALDIRSQLVEYKYFLQDAGYDLCSK